MTQKEALDLLKLGQNVFLTGAAGSGKTYLLNIYIDHLRKHGVGVSVTASTGIAATHLGGQTIHSWCGMGIKDFLTDEDLHKISTSPRVKRNIKKNKVLIIDEISMLHAHQLEMVDRIAQAVLDSQRPFGGMQVILSGDFFQLPPVSKRRGGWDSSSDLFGENGLETRFAYEGPTWERGDFKVCYLEEQWRQSEERDGKADPLLSVLNDIRNGQVGEKTKAPLRQRYQKDPETSANIKPTKLYTRNVNVDQINQKELESLDGDAKTYHMESHGFKALVDSLKRSCLAPEVLHLKVGAEVMFVKNAQDGSYVNGTLGVVASFGGTEGCPIIETFDGRSVEASAEEWRLEENGVVRATVSQVPLRLAWAITVHKSQGITLDSAEIDLSDAFEPGMGYVALSRVRSLGGLKILGLNEKALEVHPKILKHNQKFQEWSVEVCRTLEQFSEEEKSKKHEEVLLKRFEGTKDKELVKRRGEDRVKKKKIPTHAITAEFLEKEMPLEDTARERGVTKGTVIGHMEKLAGEGKLPCVDYLKDDIQDFERILSEFEKSKDGKLTPVYRKLKGKHSFDTLRIVRLFVR